MTPSKTTSPSLTPTAAATFAPSSILVARVYNGGAPLSLAAAAVFLDEVNPVYGVRVKAVNLTYAAGLGGGGPCTLSGRFSGLHDGKLSATTDGRYVTIGCRAAAVNAATSGTRALAVRMHASGKATVAFDFGGSYAGFNLEVAGVAGTVLDVAYKPGTNLNYYYVAATQSRDPPLQVGVAHVTNSVGDYTLATGITDVRDLKVYGGQLYGLGNKPSTGQSGVFTIGAGYVANPGSSLPATYLAGFATAAARNPYQFVWGDAATIWITDLRDSRFNVYVWKYAASTWAEVEAFTINSVQQLPWMTGRMEATFVLYISGPYALYALDTATGISRLVIRPDANAEFRGVIPAPFDAALAKPSASKVPTATASAPPTPSRTVTPTRTSLNSPSRTPMVQAVGPANVLVVRVGDGYTPGNLPPTAANTTHGGWIDEYTLAGLLVRSYRLPNITAGGTSRCSLSGGLYTMDGFAARSADDSAVTLSCLDYASGGKQGGSWPASSVPRVIARLTADGVVTTSTKVTDSFSGCIPRSAVSPDGTNFLVSAVSYAYNTSVSVPAVDASCGVRAILAGAATSSPVSVIVPYVVALVLFHGVLFGSVPAHRSTVGYVGIVRFGVATSQMRADPTPYLPLESLSATHGTPGAVTAFTLQTPDDVFLLDYRDHISPEFMMFRYQWNGATWDEVNVWGAPDGSLLLSLADRFEDSYTLYATSASATLASSLLRMQPDVEGTWTVIAQVASNIRLFRAVVMPPVSATSLVLTPSTTPSPSPSVLPNAFQVADLVVMRVGDGSAPTSPAAASSVFLDVYDTASDTLSWTATLPTMTSVPPASASYPCLSFGDAISPSGVVADGHLTLSEDRTTLSWACYGSNILATAPRVIAMISAQAYMDTTSVTGETTSVPSGAVVEASGWTMWTWGTAPVRVQAPLSSFYSTAIGPAAPTMLKVMRRLGLGLVAVASANSGATWGIATFGSGLPSTATTLSWLPGLAPGAWTFDDVYVQDATTLWTLFANATYSTALPFTLTGGRWLPGVGIRLNLNHRFLHLTGRFEDGHYQVYASDAVWVVRANMTSRMISLVAMAGPNTLFKGVSIPPASGAFGIAAPTSSGTTTASTTPSNTASSTLSPSVTGSRTGSVTSTASRTPSKTATRSKTPSKTASSSRSPSRTASKTVTPSRTRSVTPSVTKSASATASKSRSPSKTATPSRTPSKSASPSRTPSKSASMSRTPSRTPGSSVTSSKTASVSRTPSWTPSRTRTPSKTGSFSKTPSRTPSVTPSRSATASKSPSPSKSPSRTPSNSRSPSGTASKSKTPSRTRTPSFTPSKSKTPSRTASRSMTPSRTRSQTFTPSRTPSISFSASRSTTPSHTASSTIIAPRFATGSLMLLSVGNGTTNSTGTQPVWVHEFDTRTGAIVNTIRLPIVPTKPDAFQMYACTAPIASPWEPTLSLSGDGRLLTVGCFGLPLGLGTGATSSCSNTTACPRVVGAVLADGSTDTSTRVLDGAARSYFRGVWAWDRASGYWYSSMYGSSLAAEGLWYMPYRGTASVPIDITVSPTAVHYVNNRFMVSTRVGQAGYMGAGPLGLDSYYYAGTPSGAPISAATGTPDLWYDTVSMVGAPVGASDFAYVTSDDVWLTEVRPGTTATLYRYTRTGPAAPWNEAVAVAMPNSWAAYSMVGRWEGPDWVLYLPTWNAALGSALYRYVTTTGVFKIIQWSNNPSLLYKAVAWAPGGGIAASPTSTPSVSISASAFHASFQGGVVLVEVGPTTALTTTAAAIKLVEVNAATMAPLSTLSLPTVASGDQLPCTLPGAPVLQPEGLLTRSGDMRYLTLACYGAPVGAAITASTPRVLATIDVAGLVVTSTLALPSPVTLPRGAVVIPVSNRSQSDGAVVYAGQGSGMQSTPWTVSHSGFILTSATPTSVRVGPGGALYYATTTAPGGIGVLQSIAAPAAPNDFVPGMPSGLLPGFDLAGDLVRLAYDFHFQADPVTGEYNQLWLVDWRDVSNTLQLFYWMADPGGTWSEANAFTVVAGAQLWGIDGGYSAAGSYVLYVTTTAALLEFNTETWTTRLLYSAPGGHFVRGVAVAPEDAMRAGAITKTATYSPTKSRSPSGSSSAAATPTRTRNPLITQSATRSASRTASITPSRTATASRSPSVMQPLFNADSVLVVRVAAGVGTFVDEYTPTGALLRSVPMPAVARTAAGATAACALIANDTGVGDGKLALAEDGTFLTLACYDRNGTVNGTAPQRASAAAVPRTAARINVDASVVTTTIITDGFSVARMPAVVAANGGGFWAGGAIVDAVAANYPDSVGLRYVAARANTSVSVSASDFLGVGSINSLKWYNGTLFGAVVRPSITGIVSFGNVETAPLPTTAADLSPTSIIMMELLVKAGSGPVPQDFEWETSERAWIADPRAGTVGSLWRYDWSDLAMNWVESTVYYTPPDGCAPYALAATGVGATYTVYLTTQCAGATGGASGVYAFQPMYSSFTTFLPATPAGSGVVYRGVSMAPVNWALPTRTATKSPSPSLTASRSPTASFTTIPQLFRVGDVMVVRVGVAVPLTMPQATLQPVTIMELSYAAPGMVVSSYPLPDGTGGSGCLLPGIAAVAGEGQLTLGPNGDYLTMVCYTAGGGTGVLPGASPGAAANRTALTYTATGAVSTTYSWAVGSSTPLSAAYDPSTGYVFAAGGGTNLLYLYGRGKTGVATNTFASYGHVVAYNGSLFASQRSVAGLSSLVQVGAGTPGAPVALPGCCYSGYAAAILPGMAVAMLPARSMWGFVFETPSRVWVADSRDSSTANVYLWTADPGTGEWSEQYGLLLVMSWDVMYLAGAVPAGFSDFVLYASTPYAVLAVNTTSGAVRTLAIAPQGTQFRGLAMAPGDATFIQPTATRTPTSTNTLSASYSNTRTRTPSITPSKSVTASKSASVTPTKTASRSRTPSRTRTPSVTPSRTRTPSRSRTTTPSPSKSVTRSPSNSISPTRTPSVTRTRSASRTASKTASRSATRSRTPSATASKSRTPSYTPSRTKTPSRTPSVTPTVPLTPSRSGSPSPTPSRSATRSRTPTVTRTASRSPTRTFTPSRSRTPWPAGVSRSRTPSFTPSKSRTPTASRSMTASRSRTASNTISVTRTRSNTASFTPSRSTTPSFTPSRSRTASISRSMSPTRSVTPSRTATKSRTSSQTATRSRTPSVTRTKTQTPSGTQAVQQWGTASLIALRVGTGAASDTWYYTGAQGKTVYLDEIQSTTGIVVRSVAVNCTLPTNTVGDGVLSYAADSSHVAFGCYGGRDNMTANMHAAAGSVVPRVVAIVTGDGKVDTSTRASGLPVGLLRSVVVSTTGVASTPVTAVLSVTQVGGVGGGIYTVPLGPSTAWWTVYASLGTLASYGQLAWVPSGLAFIGGGGGVYGTGVSQFASGPNTAPWELCPVTGKLVLDAIPLSGYQYPSPAGFYQESTTRYWVADARVGTTAVIFRYDYRMPMAQWMEMGSWATPCGLPAYSLAGRVEASSTILYFSTYSRAIGTRVYRLDTAAMSFRLLRYINGAAMYKSVTFAPFKTWFSSPTPSNTPSGSPSAAPATFWNNTVVVLRTGMPGVAAPALAAQLYLDEIDVVSGLRINTRQLPQAACSLYGGAPLLDSDGQLYTESTRTRLALACYAGTTVGAPITAAHRRVVALVTASGTVDTSTDMNTTALLLRGAVVEGTSVWAYGGAATPLWKQPGSKTASLPAMRNVTAVSFMGAYGGQVYAAVADATATPFSVAALGAGLQEIGNTPAPLLGFITVSAAQRSIVGWVWQSPSVLWVADTRSSAAQVYRWLRDSGTGVWAETDAVYVSDMVPFAGVRAVTGITGAPRNGDFFLYVATPLGLYSVTASSLAVSLVFTAETGVLLRGVTLPPVDPGRAQPSPTRSPSQSATPSRTPSGSTSRVGSASSTVKPLGVVRFWNDTLNVLRVGGAGLNGTAVPGYLDQIDMRSGVVVNTTNITGCVFSPATAARDHQLSLSADGRFLLVPCFHGAAGTLPWTRRWDLAPRIVARISADGTVAVGTKFNYTGAAGGTTLLGTYVTAAASLDGSAFYLATAPVAPGAPASSVVLYGTFAANNVNPQTVYAPASPFTYGVGGVQATPTGGLAVSSIDGTWSGLRSLGATMAPAPATTTPQLALGSIATAGTAALLRVWVYQNASLLWTLDNGRLGTASNIFLYTAAGATWVEALELGAADGALPTGLVGRSDPLLGGRYTLYVTTWDAPQAYSRILRYDTELDDWYILYSAPVAATRGVFKSVALAPYAPLAKAAPTASKSPVPTPSARAYQFTPGNLLVLRVGNGTALPVGLAPLYLDEVDLRTGATVSTTPVPTTCGLPGASAWLPGEGALSLSMDGRTVTFACYAGAVGARGVSAQVLAFIDANAVADVSTRLFPGGNVTATLSADGAAAWVGYRGAWGAGLRLHVRGMTPEAAVNVSASYRTVRALAAYSRAVYAVVGAVGVTPNALARLAPSAATGPDATLTVLPGMEVGLTPARLPVAAVFQNASVVWIADPRAPTTASAWRWTLTAGEWSETAAAYFTPYAIYYLTGGWVDGHFILYGAASGAGASAVYVYNTTDGAAFMLASAPRGMAYRGVAFVPSNAAFLPPSVTRTGTVTPSKTPSRTATPSRTPSRSASALVTPSRTPSRSGTPSKTPSRSATRSKTASRTVTPTRTASRSRTRTITPSRTATKSRTPSVTPSRPATPSKTPTKGSSWSASRSPTLTPAVTRTASASVTPSVSPSRTRTPSITRSRASTPSVTPSVTRTGTVTRSRTPSNTASRAVTPSVTPSWTISPTATLTPYAPLLVAGNLLALRSCDVSGTVPGATATSSVCIDQLTGVGAAGGKIVNTFGAPVGSTMCTLGALYADDGHLALAADNRTVTFGCYGVAIGTVTPWATATQRLAAVMHIDGSFETSAVPLSAFMGQPLRAVAAADAVSGYVLSGGSATATDGLVWMARGAPATVTTLDVAPVNNYALQYVAGVLHAVSRTPTLVGIRRYGAAYAAVNSVGATASWVLPLESIVTAGAMPPGPQPRTFHMHPSRTRLWTVDARALVSAEALFLYTLNAFGTAWVETGKWTPPDGRPAYGLAGTAAAAGYTLYVSTASATGSSVYVFNTGTSAFQTVPWISSPSSYTPYKSLVWTPEDPTAPSRAPTPAATPSATPRQQALTPGNVVLLRAGNSTTLTSTPTALAVLELNVRTGAVMREAAVPRFCGWPSNRTVANAGLGGLSLSNDSRVVTFACWNTSGPGWKGPALGTPNDKYAIVFDGSAYFPTAWLLGDRTNATVKAIATWDGYQFWSAPSGNSSSGGVNLRSWPGTIAPVTTSITNGSTEYYRYLAFYRDQLYGATASQPPNGIATVGEGAPTAVTVSTLLPGMTTGPLRSPWGFTFQDPATLWVADSRAPGRHLYQWTATGGVWAEAAAYEVAGMELVTGVVGSYTASRGGYVLYAMSSSGVYVFDPRLQRAALIFSTPVGSLLGIAPAPLEADRLVATPSATFSSLPSTTRTPVATPTPTATPSLEVVTPSESATSTNTPLAPLYGSDSVIVVRVGNGITALTAAAAAVYLDEIDIGTGLLKRSTALPTVVNGVSRRCTLPGASFGDGQMMLAPTGGSLTLPCYDAAVGAVVPGTAAAAPRVVARIGSDLKIDTTTAIGDAFLTGAVRTAITPDDTTFYVGGDAGGIRQTTLGAGNKTTTLRVLGPAVPVSGLQLSRGSLFMSAAYDTYTPPYTSYTGVFQVGPVGSLPVYADAPMTPVLPLSAMTVTGLSPAPGGFCWENTTRMWLADNRISTTARLFRYDLDLGSQLWVETGAYSPPNGLNLAGHTCRAEPLRLTEIAMYMTTYSPTLGSTLYRVDGMMPTAWGIIYTTTNKKQFKGIALPPLRQPTPTATASATQTPSHTASNSVTPSNTASQTMTETSSQTMTQTPSQTASETPTYTSTPSETPSQTASESATRSETQTNSPSRSETQTNSPSRSETPTYSPSVTNTASQSTSPSETPSQTPSITGTANVTPTSTMLPSQSGSKSVTPSNTPSVTPSQTRTRSGTRTQTRSPTNTATNSRTVTRTATGTTIATASASRSPSAPVSRSDTVTPSRSVTRTGTPTRSGTNTGTPSRSGTGTTTVSPSGTASGSGTPAVTGTGTPSQTPSASATLTGTGSTSPAGTPTPSVTGTVTGTASRSPTGTATVTATRSNTASVSATASRSATKTPTPSVSPSVTPSSSTTATWGTSPSVSGSAAATSSPSQTGTGTGTGSSSRTASPSRSPASASASVTPTRSAAGTPSGSGTPSVSPSNSRSPAGTPTPSPTVSATGAGTASPTGGATDVATGSSTMTGTPTRSATATATVSPSATRSRTGTRTATRSRTVTRSATTSASVTPTRSGAGTGVATGAPTAPSTPSASVTGVQSMSGTRSVTPSISGTAVRTPSVSPSVSVTESGTLSGSRSPSASTTAAATASRTGSNTATASATVSGTAATTPTATSTSSNSATVTGTRTRSGTSTATVTPTASASASRSGTASRSAAASGAATPSGTASGSAPATQSASGSASQSASRSTSPSATPSRSGTPTTTPLSPASTPTATPSVSSSASRTPSSTASPSVTPSVTPSSSVSPSVTASNTASPSASGSGTATFSATASGTAAASDAASRTSTRTVTMTGTRSATGTPTTSRSPTQTATSTATGSAAATPAATPVSQSATSTPSNMTSPSPSVSAGASPSGTPSNSAVGTPSLATRTPSAAATAAGTSARTAAPTILPSASSSASASVTASSTPSRTPTTSTTSTVSPTGTPSPSTTASVTATTSRTATGTATATASATVTATRSATASVSTSAAPSGALSAAATPSRSPSNLATASTSASVSSAATPPGTPARTLTATVSAAVSDAPTPTVSPSFTVTTSVSPSKSASPSGTPSSTVTPSVTASVTATGTVTRSGTMSGTASVTSGLSPSPTRSATMTRTGTRSRTGTRTGTATRSATRTGTVTSTGTALPTATASVTAAATASDTAAATVSATGTASESGTSTVSGTGSASSTGSGTATASATGTGTVTRSMTGTMSGTMTGSGTPSTTASNTPSRSGTQTVSPSASASTSATPSATPSTTGTPTRSATGTATRSGTASVTPSASVSPSGTKTPSPSRSGTQTGTPTPPFTVTATRSATTTGTPSVSGTVSGSPSNTPSRSATPTGTGTISPTPSNTPSLTHTASYEPTPSPTVTATPSRSGTVSATVSGTGDSTATRSPTPSGTPSLTPAETPSNTDTPTFTRTGTRSGSGTSTVTATASDSPSITASPTVSSSGTSTGSATQSHTSTPSMSPSGTASPTVTPSTTLSRSATRTRTGSDTVTPTLTRTGTATASASSSASVTATETPSGTASVSGTLTGTRSSTATPSSSLTAAATATPSTSAAETLTPTRSATGTATVSPSGSGTVSGTPATTTTPTQTPSATASTSYVPPSDTVTVTRTPSQSPSVTRTPSASPSTSATVTQTFSWSATGSVTASPSETASQSASPSATASVTETATMTGTPTVTETATSSATATRSGTVTATSTGTGSTTPSQTVSPTVTRTAAQTPTATLSLGASPSRSAAASQVPPTPSVSNWRSASQTRPPV